MAQEEFTVVLDGVELSDEQRTTLNEAIQKSVLAVLSDVEWQPLGEEALPEVRELLASRRPAGTPLLMGMMAWPAGKPPWRRG